MKLGEENKLYLTSGESIRIENLEISGTKPRPKGKNSTISIDTTELIIKGLEATEVECYNLVEQVYSANSRRLKKVYVSGVETGIGVKHNIFNLYNLGNNAEVIFEGCKFNLWKDSNALRLDNLGEARGVKIKFIDCSWTYEENQYSQSDLPWMALVLFQPGLKAQQGKSVFESWEVSLKGCKYNNEKIWRANEWADNIVLEGLPSVACYYDPTESNPSLPKISII